MKMTLQSSPSFAHNVLGGLWIGNAPPVKSMHEDGVDFGSLANFDTLILCAQEYQPEAGLFDVGEVVHAPMDDNPVMMTTRTASMAVRAAKHVVSALSEGKTVLVTCLAGRNRSGLVCALALCFGPPKMTADDAIRTVRGARGNHALANPLFVKFLRSLTVPRGVGY